MARLEAFQEVRVLIPTDRDSRWLPEPIPTSYYGRAAGARRTVAPPFASWVARLGRWPDRRLLAIAAVAVLGAGFLAALVHLGARGQAPPPQSGVTHDSRAAPISPPSLTPLAAAPTATPAPTPTPTPTARSTATPAPPRITFLDAPLRAQRGDTVTLQAVTAPGTACAITVGYASAPALALASASGAGRVSWSWTLTGHTPAGTWPIQVSCGGATASTTITITTD